MAYIIKRIPAFKYEELSAKAKEKAREAASQLRSEIEQPDDYTDWLRERLRYEFGFIIDRGTRTHRSSGGPWWSTFSQGSGVAWTTDDIDLDIILDSLGWDKHAKRKLKAALNKYGVEVVVKHTGSNYAHYNTMSVSVDWEKIPDAKVDPDFDLVRYVTDAATGERIRQYHNGFRCDGMRKLVREFEEQLLEYVKGVSKELHRDLEAVALEDMKEESLIDNGYLAHGWYDIDGNLLVKFDELDDNTQLETNHE